MEVNIFRENENRVTKAAVRTIRWLFPVYPILILLSLVGAVQSNLEKLLFITVVAAVVTQGPYIAYKRNISIHTMKYITTLALAIMVALMAMNTGIGIYMTYAFAMVFSLFYYDKRFTVRISLISYILLEISLYVRSLQVQQIEFDTNFIWFITRSIGFLIETLVMSLICVKIAELSYLLLVKLQNRTLENIQRTKQMLQMQTNVIEGMATLIESRDGNTGEHVMNTKNYVSMIVQYMYAHQMHPEEITEDYIEKIMNAAPLHDVGKILISDTILNKPGRFTREEYEIMKSHSGMGGDIVKNILGKNADKDLVRIACDVALFHHERWDGSGYPTGRKEEQIPLCARIMAVADVFDALVSKRVYKDGMTVEQAYDILREESGSHFDPQIVDVFFEIRKDVEAYLRQSAAS